MKNLFLFFMLLIIPISFCSKQQEKQSAQKNQNRAKNIDNLVLQKISWYFEDAGKADFDETLPLTNIYLIIDSDSTKILDKVQGEFYEVEKKDFEDNDIPKEAVSVCMGGWAGLYRIVYVEKQQSILLIKQAWSDAESGVDGWQDLEVIKKIEAEN